MVDRYPQHQTGPTDAAVYASAITPHNSNELPFVTRGIYVGVGGDIVVILSGDSAAVTLKNVPTGSILPIRAKIVQATNTTATNLIALD